MTASAKNNLAYVRYIPAYFGLGSIHVCQPAFHNLTPLQRMATLVHEGAHRYIDATDDTYFTLIARRRLRRTP